MVIAQWDLPRRGTNGSRWSLLVPLIAEARGDNGASKGLQCDLAEKPDAALLVFEIPDPDPSKEREIYDWSSDRRR